MPHLSDKKKGKFGGLTEAQETELSTLDFLVGSVTLGGPSARSKFLVGRAAQRKQERLERERKAKAKAALAAILGTR